MVRPLQTTYAHLGARGPCPSGPRVPRPPGEARLHPLPLRGARPEGERLPHPHLLPEWKTDQLRRRKEEGVASRLRREDLRARGRLHRKSCEVCRAKKDFCQRPCVRVRGVHRSGEEVGDR
uniref:Zn(2)-C6 fungal-type domain-containing protein n=1 Tax=Steinernema glaseri TaxID=37863 RepID=A0A1I7YXV7_9BILA